jgi:hypothetical protein
LFASENFDRFVEINLERGPEVALLFTSNDPRSILMLLPYFRNCPARWKKCPLLSIVASSVPVGAGAPSHQSIHKRGMNFFIPSYRDSQGLGFTLAR